MEKELIQQFNLPGYIKGKSFADASKRIEDKFEGRNDKASLDTKEELIQRLAEAQEYLKMKESLAANSGEVPDMMNGEVPEGMEQFAGGGSLDSIFAVNPEAQAELGSVTNSPDAIMGDAMQPKALGAGVGSYLGAASTGLDLGSNFFGNADVDVSGNEFVEKQDVGAGVLSGAMKGAKAGMSFGPLGAVAGGLFGGVSGFVGGKKQNRAASQAQNNFYMAQSKENRSDFKKGGQMYQAYDGGGFLDEIFKVKNPLFTQDLTQNQGGTPELATPGINPRSGLKLFGQKSANWLGQNYGNIAQYAPVLGNLTTKLDRPDTPRGTRVDSMYDRQLFDPNSLINRVNQNDVSRSLTEASGGDLGALRTNLLAANLNKDKAISEAAIQGEGINRDEGRYAYQTGMQRDMFNAQLDERYLQRKGQDEGAYNTAKGNLRRALFEDIGAIGREEVDKKLVRDMFGYTWDGRYFTDKKGNKFTQKEVAAKLKEKENAG